jgi:hypothetical protein
MRLKTSNNHYVIRKLLDIKYILGQKKAPGKPGAGLTPSK